MRITQRIPSPTEQRARKILERPFRFIFNADFDNPKKRKEILGEMPDIEKFNEQRKKVVQLRNGDKIAPEMRPCYEEPLLTREQEYHLFRKMNYFKYRAKKLMADLNPRRCSDKRLDKIESLLEEANKIRNQIGNSNFRLATQLLRKQSSFYREHSLTDGLLSDAYFDVLKAIDYFNFNLGNKFSTYCTWVLRKNFSRDLKNQAKYQERFTTGMEDPLNEIKDDGDGYKEEITYENNRKLVDKLLELLAESDCNGDVQRQVYAIEEWFGLHGKEHRTLDAISQDMDVTKERVRQLKEKGLQVIREKVKELGIVFEEADEEEVA
jgi:RNA polymerase primary sigma factor/RNA polymerase sigma factor